MRQLQISVLMMSLLVVAGGALFVAGDGHLPLIVLIAFVLLVAFALMLEHQIRRQRNQ
ncbi:hypothetical protein ACHIPZ_20655 [Antrihabitans sp. NCIMB 15449]